MCVCVCVSGGMGCGICVVSNSSEKMGGESLVYIYCVYVGGALFFLICTTFHYDSYIFISFAFRIFKKIYM